MPDHRKPEQVQADTVNRLNRLTAEEPAPRSRRLMNEDAIIEALRQISALAAEGYTATELDAFDQIRAVADVAIADAKAMNDKWADEVAAHRETSARLAQVTQERDAERGERQVFEAMVDMNHLKWLEDHCKDLRAQLAALGRWEEV